VTFKQLVVTGTRTPPCSPWPESHPHFDLIFPRRLSSSEGLNVIPTKEPSSKSGVVLDYDADSNLAGIDLDNASRKLDLRELITSHIPLVSESV
jgi:hypothetical protein